MTEAPGTAEQIGPGSVVTLHLSLALADGTEVLSTFDEEPLNCRVGDGTILEALEENLHGLSAGEKQTFLLSPEHAYGDRDPGQVHAMAISDFAQNPEAGQVISFSLPNGEETTGTVVEIEGDQVRVDFNHPLAGHNLVFRVEILDVNAVEKPS